MTLSLFIKSYLSLLILLGLGSIVFFACGLFLIIKINRTPKLIKTSPISVLASEKKNDSLKLYQVTSNDIRAISGGDEIATQLDLARAYIETGRKQIAKKMLDHIIQKGNDTQQQEAQYLLDLLV